MVASVNTSERFIASCTKTLPFFLSLALQIKIYEPQLTSAHKLKLACVCISENTFGCWYEAFCSKLFPMRFSGAMNMFLVLSRFWFCVSSTKEYFFMYPIAQ